MLENIFSYGIQVRGVLNVADVVSNGFDHYIAGWQDQLVGPDLRSKCTCEQWAWDTEQGTSGCGAQKFQHGVAPIIHLGPTASLSLPRSEAQELDFSFS